MCDSLAESVFVQKMTRLSIGRKKENVQVLHLYSIDTQRHGN